ncbi:hypothetical protein AN958_07222 [Leucoagaricus sp. SymC.cos]|nr:hypothetical protein AN958_07859 [Leucoagaricus sp. SymC.cos]KXN88527.1 hypothetical protein AN958_07222 [Leucoagaricus sp. SymC.cos]
MFHHHLKRHLTSRANSTVTEPTGPPTFSNSYTTTALTSILACAIPMIALIFLATISWALRYSMKNPRPINKVSGYRLQRYAPLFYIFLFLASLAEIATSSWLLCQYEYHRNYPNLGTRTGVTFLLFVACWTSVTAGVYSVLFIHPVWSQYSISSVGSQVLWIFVTWILWIVGSGLINAAVPSLLVKGSCANIVYCGQVRSLFALGVLESLTLTSSMLVVILLAWQSTRDILKPVDVPRKGQA